MGKRGPQPIPEWDRFWPKVDAAGPCWEWAGYRNPKGYGGFRAHLPDGRVRCVPAHRWAWEALVGPVPAGMDVHHMCGNRACVNVGEHLALVTHSENLNESWGRTRLNALKTHCPRGHPYEGENVQANGRSRRCATCHRERERGRRQA